MTRDNRERISCSFRISAATAADLREFVRRQRGEPLFLELGAFVDEAIQRHLEYTQGQLRAQRQAPNRNGPKRDR